MAPPSIYRFTTHEVRELAWVFEGPGLLKARADTNASLDTKFDHVESDEVMRARIEPLLGQLYGLDREPAPLLSFLAALPSQGRLGRYFENLLRYYLVHLARVPEIAMNTQVKGERGITKGELDLVFRDRLGQPPIHWEASVKFYICSTTDPLEAKQTRFFTGTLVFDRLDLKLAKMLDQQLRLPQSPAGMKALDALGFSAPASRALLKGFLFYPSHLDWRNHPHPEEISKAHARGWWTTSELRALPRTHPDSLYLLLEPERWLAPFQGPVLREALFTRDQLLSLVDEYFAGEITPALLRREMMVAEVLEAPPPRDLLTNEALVWVRELSRGNVLHAEWPSTARVSAEEGAKEPS